MENNDDKNNNTNNNQEPKGLNERILAKLESIESRQDAIEDSLLNNKPDSNINTSGFDVTKLSLAERQALKEALAFTPDANVKKNNGNTLTLRKIEGKYVIAFGKAYKQLVDDEVLQKKVEREYIKISFFGEEKPSIVSYRDFQLSERVSVEIVEKIAKTIPVSEGQIMSKQTGSLIEANKMVVADSFKIRLPEGDLVTINGEYANG